MCTIRNPSAWSAGPSDSITVLASPIGITTVALVFGGMQTSHRKRPSSMRDGVVAGLEHPIGEVGGVLLFRPCHRVIKRLLVPHRVDVRHDEVQFIGQRHLNITIHKSGIPHLPPLKAERRLVLSNRTTDRKSVLVTARREQSPHLKEGPCIKNAILMGVEQRQMIVAQKPSGSSWIHLSQRISKL